MFVHCIIDIDVLHVYLSIRSSCESNSTTKKIPLCFTLYTVRTPYTVHVGNLNVVLFVAAKGLSHLRAHNFVHRDIKPGNIMRCGTQDGRYHVPRQLHCIYTCT